nr:replication protein A 70 kDa DNA-binding subunit B [Tanacetum cinerariifolium]
MDAKRVYGVWMMENYDLKLLTKLYTIDSPDIVNNKALNANDNRIIKIHRKHGSAYLGCKKCGNITKQTDAEGINWWNCKLHGRITVDAVVIMYRLIIWVMDDTGSTSLLFFDDLVFNLSSIESYTLINQYGFASLESESSSLGSGKRTIIDLDNYNEEEAQASKGNKIVKLADASCADADVDASCADADAFCADANGRLGVHHVSLFTDKIGNSAYEEQRLWKLEDERKARIQRAKKLAATLRKYQVLYNYQTKYDSDDGSLVVLRIILHLAYSAKKSVKWHFYIVLTLI